MHRVFLGYLIVLSLPAFSQSPNDYYQQLAGRWESPSGDTVLIYSVDKARIRVQGETCATAGGSSIPKCGIIDQDYRLKNTGMMRDHSAFGSLPVQILELTKSRFVKKEVNPVAPDRSAITTEELVGGDTLVVTSEAWIEGKAQSRERFVLKRQSPVETAESFTAEGVY